MATSVFPTPVGPPITTRSLFGISLRSWAASSASSYDLSVNSIVGNRFSKVIFQADNSVWPGECASQGSAHCSQ